MWHLHILCAVRGIAILVYPSRTIVGFHPGFCLGLILVRVAIPNSIFGAASPERMLQTVSVSTPILPPQGPQASKNQPCEPLRELFRMEILPCFLSLRFRDLVLSDWLSSRPIVLKELSVAVPRKVCCFNRTAARAVYGRRRTWIARHTSIEIELKDKRSAIAVRRVRHAHDHPNLPSGDLPTSHQDRELCDRVR